MKSRIWGRNGKMPQVHTYYPNARLVVVLEVIKVRRAARFFAIPCLVLFVALSGCVSVKTTSTDMDGKPHTTIDHGYALIYELMGKEKKVAKLLIIKRERPELGALIKEIAARCEVAHKDLEALAKADPSLNIKDIGLPVAEVQTRGSISKVHAKELLAEGGKEFELQILLTQNEAMLYGANIASVTAKVEKNPERIKFLNQLSDDLNGLEKRLNAMLTENYAWPGRK
jgi:hypothetical protein